MAEHKLKTWLNKAVDWVWPRLHGEPEPSPDEQLMITATDGMVLDEIENTVERRTGQVDERLRTVETKLVALLTLTSVLSAAVTAGFAVASTIQIQKGFPLIPVWLTLVLVFYIALNLLRSLWATVTGLMRRGYKQLTCEDIIPKDKEDKIRYKARLLNQRLNHACIYTIYGTKMYLDPNDAILSKDLNSNFGEWDVFCTKWVKEAYRVLKPDSGMVIFVPATRFESLMNQCIAVGLEYVQPWFWQKSNPGPRQRVLLISAY